MRLPSLVIASALMLVGCRLGPKVPDVDPEAQAEAALEEGLHFEIDEELSGLRIALSEADATAGGGPRLPPAEAEVLTDEETRGLLARVPGLEMEDGDVQTFAFRERSEPPPRTGATVEMAFPPPAAPPLPDAPEPGVLRVLRHAPEGDIPMAPHLSVTFDQPMLAITSQEEAAEVRPLTLEPEPSGQWRWVGTKTVLFEPDVRFPMATTYTVTVPEGTTSAVEGTLPEAETWSFTTPPPQVQTWLPWDGPYDLQPLVFLGFDQRIDTQAMAPFVEVTAGEARFALRLATEAEIERDEGIAAQVEAAEPDRFVVLAFEEPLPRDTRFEITVKTGAPSAEGPNTTLSDQRSTFYTYAPLAIVEQHCGWGHAGCQPDAFWSLRFNNPIDEEAFDPATIAMDPNEERRRARASGFHLQFYGNASPRTKYEVTIPADLKDGFGQTLGEDEVRTFEVGGLYPSLRGPDRDFLVVDPVGAPTYPVYSTNHEQFRLKVYAASPAEYPALSTWMREARYDGYVGLKPPLTLIHDEVMPVPGFVADELVETGIDLSPWLEGEHGQLFLWLEQSPQPTERWNQVHVFSWVQATDIGLSAYSDYEDLLVWSSSLTDGSPLEGVELSLLGLEGMIQTDATGLGVSPLYSDGTGPHVLVAKHGDDLAILPERTGWWNQWGGWQKSFRNPALRWYVFDDRHMYRPAETVSVKGWVRRFDPGRGGDISGAEGHPSSLTWTAQDVLGNEIGKGETTLTETGGFDFAFELPKTPNLGGATVILSGQDTGGLSGGTHYHRFQIQEFRRPEFEVSASADPGPYFLGEHAELTVDAQYYAGGALPGAPVTWDVTSAQATFIPPNQDDFRFGTWVPWWRYWGGNSTPWNPPQSLSGETDPLGNHHLRVDFLAVNPPRPMTVTAEARVVDVNRQTWTASTTVMMHPSALYVGVRPDKTTVDKGEELELDLVAVDIDGKPVLDQAIDVSFARLEWTKKGGSWLEVEQDPSTCAIGSKADPVSCVFVPEEGGNWVVRARVNDSVGRPNETELRLWVTGGPSKPQRSVDMESLVLIPDKEHYQPGDMAEVVVQAPWPDGEGTWSLFRNGRVSTERFSMKGNSLTLNIPIEENHVPNVILDVDLVGRTERTNDDGEPLPDAEPRPAHASGSLTLKVPPLSRTLAVTVTPAVAALSPGGSTSLEVEVMGADGTPIAAEVAVIAVDEAVLALSGYDVPDPIAIFYSATGGGVSERHLRNDVVLRDPETVPDAEPDPPDEEEEILKSFEEFGYLGDEEASGVLGGNGNSIGIGGLIGAKESKDGGFRQAAAKGRGLKKKPQSPRPMAQGNAADPAATEHAAEPSGGPIAVRKDFTATALFAPHVLTNASGRATVELDLPDSLTRYRIVAVAVAGEQQFGKGESTVTARLPVMLRPSPPRFLNFGDRMELPLVVQNQTDAPLVVEIALQATNAAIVPDVSTPPGDDVVRIAGRRMTVPAEDRVEIRIPVAAQMAGRARFQAVIAAGDFADAAGFDFPVWTPATAEAFATYGEIDEGVMVQPVQAPKDVWTQFGGLQVTTSSTTLQALTDAFLYLVQYPYECNEQISSRVMSVAALRDVLDAFEADGLPSKAELDVAMERDIARLQVRQHYNGGFSWWRRDDVDWPYPSVHVVHALARAQSKGYDVPPEMISAALPYLRDIESHIPGWYSRESRWTIIGYSIHVRRLLGDDDPAKARALLALAGVDDLPLEAQGWILPTLHAAGATADVAKIIRHWENNTTETAAGAHFVTSYDDGAYVLLHSDRRVDGVLLEALIEVRPEHDLIPKLVRGLLGHRKAGRWGNTQENALILLAMDAYFHAYESKTPDFVARVWLGDEYAGEHAFVGRTTERANIDIPLGYLTDPGGEQDLVIHKDGEGRLYYRIGLTYAPKDLTYEAADYGFTVLREYDSIDDPDDVRRDGDGVWHIRAGARVRVRLTMVAPMRRYHVALVDPLPAGLEPLNPALKVSGTVPADPSATTSGYWWWNGTWYEHQNMRDERVEAYTSLLWDGVHSYTYVATATTPGEFVVPPAKAEEMYHPETFGRSGSDRVIIEAAISEEIAHR